MHEIDLHGLKYAEALERFIEEHNRTAESGSQTALKVVHGYGSSGTGGEIRKAIRALLSRNPASGEFVKGEVSEGNPGYTIVYPRRRLPQAKERLWDSVLEYCSTPRTRQQVVRKFVRRSGEHEVAQALRELETRGKLKSFYKNGRKCYEHRPR